MALRSSDSSHLREEKERVRFVVILTLFDSLPTFLLCVPFSKKNRNELFFFFILPLPRFWGALSLTRLRAAAVRVAAVNLAGNLRVLFLFAIVEKGNRAAYRSGKLRLRGGRTWPVELELKEMMSIFTK